MEFEFDFGSFSPRPGDITLHVFSLNFTEHVEIRITLLMLIFVVVLFKPHMGAGIIFPVSSRLDAHQLHESFKFDLVESIGELLAYFQELLVLESG